MELVNTNNQNSLDLAPKLKSSPIPILFVSFNSWDGNCFNCGDGYARTLSYGQQYCRKCLSQYITDITDSNTYLDMCISINIECNEHEMRDKELLIQNIQEWCENCSRVSYFKQIPTDWLKYFDKYSSNEKDCKLCGKLVYYQHNNKWLKFKVCSNCYQISSGQIESTLTKNPIPILYLPWWDNKSSCIACDSNLKFPSDCQKYCSNCCIVYTGCRYCLTTNIIFGFTDRSQCKKCKRFITIDENVSSNDFLYNSILNPYDLQLDEIIDDVRKADNPMDIYTFIGEKHRLRNANPTLKLKSTSPIPILFVSFNQKGNQKCFHCGNNYFKLLYYHHRYCKQCLLNYIADVTNVNTQLGAGACICEHGMDSNDCLECYQISSGWVESTLTKKRIPILYLPWWDNKNGCIACNSELEFMSDCQKYCTYCCIIYIGCRYCLTTNIIFGFTAQSQCKKCKRILIIIDTNISDNFLYNSMFNYNNYNLQLAEIIDDVKKTDNHMDIYRFIREKYKTRNTNPIMKLTSSSPIPILFVSFNQNDQNCFHCGDEYIQQALYNQRYCEECLLCYFTDITTDNNTYYLDVNTHNYPISSGWVESTLNKKPIPILYLLWWDNKNSCMACHSTLKSTSDCQKYCTHCCIIYAGCRYCLTTNVIFGFIDKSQCKECERIFIIDANISDNVLYNSMFNYINYNNYNLQLAEIIDDVKKTDNHMDIYRFIREKCKSRNTNPRLELKSSSTIPILFISFSQHDQNCFHCGDKYIQDLYSQKYCKKCLLCYITDNNVYLDVNTLDYPISSEQVESTFIKKLIPILYLPWWDNKNSCIACHSILNFISDRQKYCSNCYIFYTGCRFCLTTNIVFGLANKSQCKKCKRTYDIAANVSSGNTDLDEFLHDSRHNNLQLAEIIDNVKNDPMGIYQFINKKSINTTMMEWIPYSQITNIKKIAKGGFSIIYQATWLDGSLDESHLKNNHSLICKKRNETIIIKRFENSQNISKYFLNELKSNHHCYEFRNHVIRSYGFTKDPESKDYMLVMKYASGGDLYNYLQKNFVEITWNRRKLDILWEISRGLESIHNANFIHRDFHSGNILLDLEDVARHQWQIGDLGLSQPANYLPSNNEIYGVIPYIAPEIFKGSAFSKESDVYSLGMIMWELTTGCKPLVNDEHSGALICQIVNGKRPEITNDTPECFANLMKSCWDPDPKKRPSVTEICKTLIYWCFGYGNFDQFNQAEIKRKELINLRKLGPEFAAKPNSKAIYTSRSLRSLISESSSINSFSFDSKQDYISKEQEFDI